MDDQARKDAMADAACLRLVARDVWFSRNCGTPTAALEVMFASTLTRFKHRTMRNIVYDARKVARDAFRACPGLRG